MLAWPMSRGRKLALGLASVVLSGIALGVNGAVLLMLWPASGVADAAMQVGERLLTDPTLALLGAVLGGFLLYALSTVAGILMVIDCSRRLHLRTDLSPARRRLGSGLLLALNTIVLPLAWYFLVWREPAPGSQPPAAADDAW
jgi:hypothetical protein